MKKLFLKLLFFLPVILIVFAINWIVDPANIKNDDSFERGVGSLLASGKNVATKVANCKERKLQKSVVLGLERAPEVVVLGSSRSFQINATSFPGRRIFNNSVSGGGLEDYLAIFDLYATSKLLPRTVVLGLDPWILNRNSGQTEWQELSGEYADMKSGLGLSASPSPCLPTSSFDPAKHKKYREFFSPAYFSQSCEDLLMNRTTGRSYWATEKVKGEEHIRLADGSYVYGSSFRERTLERINTDARKYVSTVPLYALGGFTELDPASMEVLDRFLGYLQNRGIQVVLYLSPYHPLVYKFINSRPEYAMVAESEKWFRQLARKHNTEIAGSFDPSAVQLTERDFYDGMHPKREGVEKIIAASHPAAAWHAAAAWSPAAHQASQSE